MKNKINFNLKCISFYFAFRMKVYDLIEQAIDVRFMDVPNVTSIILDYIETNIYHLDYLEVDNTLLDPDYDETRYILKACILASNEDEAYELLVSHFKSLGREYKLIDKDYFMGNLTMNEEKRYFTSPKVHHIFTELHLGICNTTLVKDLVALVVSGLECICKVNTFVKSNSTGTIKTCSEV